VKLYGNRVFITSPVIKVTRRSSYLLVDTDHDHDHGYVFENDYASRFDHPVVLCLEYGYDHGYAFEYEFYIPYYIIYKEKYKIFKKIC
jgi:hypothetical protein